MFKKFLLLQLSLAVVALAASGCASTNGKGGGVETRAYIAEKDRIDQKMEGGNFGYVTGKPKAPDTSKMSKSRKVYVLEFTKNPDVTPEDLRKGVPPSQPVPINVPERPVHESAPAYQPPAPITSEAPSTNAAPEAAAAPQAAAATPSDYVIQKNDTLQKISKKVYGTYKKWYKIYEANKDILPDPNRIKPGLTIRIP